MLPKRCLLLLPLIESAYLIGLASLAVNVCYLFVPIDIDILKTCGANHGNIAFKIIGLLSALMLLNGVYKVNLLINLLYATQFLCRLLLPNREIPN